jgi:hypothetical protein
MSELKAWKLISLFWLFTFLLGCESKEEQIQKTIKYTLQQAEQEINSLGKALDGSQIRNARLLSEYGQVLAQQNPSLSAIANLVSQDATRQGPLYQSLLTRLAELKNPAPTMTTEEILLQGELLKSAATKSLFADALTDPINVLADMSQGALARVGAMSKQAEDAYNGSNASAGNQLVGNSNYGQWQTNSSGISFWQWYGMYRIFGDVMDLIEYRSWNRHRRYSYYSDYGRKRYTGYKDYKKQTQFENRKRQSFKRQGKQFKSPYARTKTGASGLSRSSYTPPATRSSYSRSSSYAKSSSGSLRNSSSRTSRGVSRGK